MSKSPARLHAAGVGQLRPRARRAPACLLSARRSCASQTPRASRLLPRAARGAIPAPNPERPSGRRDPHYRFCTSGATRRAIAKATLQSSRSGSARAAARYRIRPNPSATAATGDATGYFPATAPERRPPPARWLCHDRARRRIRTLGSAQQQALAAAIDTRSVTITSWSPCPRPGTPGAVRFRLPLGGTSRVGRLRRSRPRHGPARRLWRARRTGRGALRGDTIVAGGDRAGMAPAVAAMIAKTPAARLAAPLAAARRRRRYCWRRGKLDRTMGRSLHPVRTNDRRDRTAPGQWSAGCAESAARVFALLFTPLPEERRARCPRPQRTPPFAAGFLTRPERFELPTFGSVVVHLQGFCVR